MKAYSLVQIHSNICPECGKIYVSGGTTTTFYSEKQKAPGTDNADGQRRSAGINLYV